MVKKLKCTYKELKHHFSTGTKAFKEWCEHHMLSHTCNVEKERVSQNRNLKIMRLRTHKGAAGTWPIFSCGEKERVRTWARMRDKEVSNSVI